MVEDFMKKLNFDYARSQMKINLWMSERTQINQKRNSKKTIIFVIGSIKTKLYQIKFSSINQILM